MLFKEMLGRLFTTKAFLVAPYDLEIGTIVAIKTKVIGTSVIEGVRSESIQNEIIFGYTYWSHNFRRIRVSKLGSSQMRMGFRKFDHFPHMIFFFFLQLVSSVVPNQSLVFGI